MFKPCLKPEVEAKPCTFTPDLDGLIEFCASKPAGEPYNYWDCEIDKRGCLLIQFANTHGYAADTGGLGYQEWLRAFTGVSWKEINWSVARPKPWTFGAARTRALSLRNGAGS